MTLPVPVCTVFTHPLRVSLVKCSFAFEHITVRQRTDSPIKRKLERSKKIMKRFCLFHHSRYRTPLQIYLGLFHLPFLCQFISPTAMSMNLSNFSCLCLSSVRHVPRSSLIICYVCSRLIGLLFVACVQHWHRVGPGFIGTVVALYMLYSLGRRYMDRAF